MGGEVGPGLGTARQPLRRCRDGVHRAQPALGRPAEPEGQACRVGLAGCGQAGWPTCCSSSPTPASRPPAVAPRGQRVGRGRKGSAQVDQPSCLEEDGQCCQPRHPWCAASFFCAGHPATCASGASHWQLHLPILGLRQQLVPAGRQAAAGACACQPPLWPGSGLRRAARMGGPAAGKQQPTPTPSHLAVVPQDGAQRHGPVVRPLLVLLQLRLHALHPAGADTKVLVVLAPQLSRLFSGRAHRQFEAGA